MVPKKLHIVWIGDESKRPDKLINTWREKNPTYELKIWGNKEYEETEWKLKRHMDQVYDSSKPAVADMMRYEILVNEGGITLDADSECLAPLEDWLLVPSAFTNWEHEHIRPGLLGVNMMGGTKGHPFWKLVVETLNAIDRLPMLHAWIATGPKFLTQVYRQTKYPLTVYPSHYCVKDHFKGGPYTGDGQVFATQMWASTTEEWFKDKDYADKLHGRIE